MNNKYRVFMKYGRWAIWLLLAISFVTAAASSLLAPEQRGDEYFYLQELARFQRDGLWKSYADGISHLHVVLANLLAAVTGSALMGGKLLSILLLPLALLAGIGIVKNLKLSSEIELLTITTLAFVLCVSKSGVMLMEGFMYRHHTQHSFVQNMVKQGEIGEPWLFSAWFGFPSFPPNDFRMNKAMGGGALLDAGAYVVNAARFFFQSEPASSHACLQLDQAGLDMRGTAILDFGGDRIAEVAFGMNNSYKNSYSIWGTKGEITLLRAFSIPAWEQPVAVIKNQGLKREYVLPACDHFTAELDAFSAFIREQKYDYDEPVYQAMALDLLRAGKQGGGKATS